MKSSRCLAIAAAALLGIINVSNVSGQTKVERPESIKKQMAERGEQDKALPTLKIVSPKPGETISGNSVTLKLELGGDLKGYHPHKDPATGMGNHIHVILDNQPYEAYYEIDTPFELKNLAPGQHTLRVFASRPWHESYKNAGVFQMVTFNVQNSQATLATKVTVNAKKPLLTYSRPKGEYKGAAADAIMIDFWLANTKLKGDGGKYQVHYSIDGGAPQMVDKWEPFWLSGWSAGKHTVKLELVDAAGKLVENGGYNSTTREITVVK